MVKILIIGGSGFIGNHLCKFLSKNKFNINTIIKKKKRSFKYIKKVNYIICDILNTKKLKEVLKQPFEIIINCSGNINHSNKKQTFKSHLTGLKNLLKYVDKKHLGLFIQLGSSLEYGRLTSPQKETKICRPISSYGKAKYLASKSLIDSKIKNYLILRLYQIYGPGQKFDRLIPYTIKSCLNDKKFKCSNGEQLRDFLYIDDLILLIKKILLKNKKVKSGVYNIGFGKPVKVKQIITMINKITKSGSPQFGKIKMREDEQKKLYPSIKKIAKVVNWKPKTKIFVGIKKTINFYRNNFND